MNDEGGKVEVLQNKVDGDGKGSCSKVERERR